MPDAFEDDEDWEPAEFTSATCRPVALDSGETAPAPGLGDSELLASATRFSFGRFADPMAQLGDWIDVEAVPGQDATRWIVCCGRWVFARSGRWVLEPCSAEHLAETRCADRDDAIAVARRLIADGHPDTAAWKRRRVD